MASNSNITTSNTDTAVAANTVDTLLNGTLVRLSSALPKLELEQIEKEATEVEEILSVELARLDEILKTGKIPKLLENVSDASKKKAMTIREMLTSFETPADKYGLTVSALLGRLRTPLHTPHPPNSTLIHHVAAQKAGKTEPSKAAQMNAKHKELVDLEQNRFYTLQLTGHANNALLSLWKKVSGYKNAVVFRKAVSERDAPGYSNRILFPVDLGLIRKMILSQIIQSFRDFHLKIGLMCHNCVKFNGRESEYGILTREFEAFVDDSVLQAVKQVSQASAASAAAAGYTPSNNTAASSSEKVDATITTTAATTATKVASSVAAASNNRPSIPPPVSATLPVMPATFKPPPGVSIKAASAVQVAASVSIKSAQPVPKKMIPPVQMPPLRVMPMPGMPMHPMMAPVPAPVTKTVSPIPMIGVVPKPPMSIPTNNKAVISDKNIAAKTRGKDLSAVQKSPMAPPSVKKPASSTASSSSAPAIGSSSIPKAMTPTTTVTPAASSSKAATSKRANKRKGAETTQEDNKQPATRRSKRSRNS